jgi:succinate dehydrogenase/fumarate reductase cytochrome b subunit
VATTGETIAFLVAAALVWIGVVRIRRGRTLDGYRTFDHALLVEIFVGQVFAFVAHSFAAIWGFLFAVALLVTLRFMIRQEQRLAAERAHPPAPTNGPAGPPPREPVVAAAPASQ